MLPPAGERAGQRPSLRHQLDPGAAEPPAVDPRVFVDVGLGVRRLTPFAERMEISVPVGSAVDEGNDVITGPPVACNVLPAI